MDQKRQLQVIKKLDFSDLEILKTSLKIQHEAEAQLIGSRNIPPLQETINQLKEAPEIFLGYFDSVRSSPNFYT